jgi:hypothetical protein
MEFCSKQADTWSWRIVLVGVALIGCRGLASPVREWAL